MGTATLLVTGPITSGFAAHLSRNHFTKMQIGGDIPSLRCQDQVGAVLCALNHVTSNPASAIMGSASEELVEEMLVNTSIVGPWQEFQRLPGLDDDLQVLIMRRNPFGMDICCRKGSRSPLQELYNPTQLSNTAILHQIRRDQVTDTCRANSVSSKKRRVLTPNDLKHLVVDEDHEMIYCYVPKVACTNWKRVMMVLTGRGKYSDPMEIPANEAHVSSNLKTLNQYSIPEINHRLKNYMKFLFVREPFERLVSAYRNKFTQKYNTSFHKRYGTKIVRRQRKNATQEALRKGDDVKFEEFVAYLIDPHTQREEPFNEHWQTVYSLCHPCHIHYDLIGKYETLEEDSNYILQLAGVGNYLKFPTYAKSTRTTDEMTTEFFQNISSEHQTQLYEVYKLDFLMFNYSVPSYLKLE
ncbi:carbohydrate sulfotransferase 11 [Limosa lapponica baueri]|uniref:Carbohydrate sulfotransferase n=2 Tax=Charadriiformes TaxID=8906 RepID=A0A2I0U3S9_LIMLA|nr:carbohydrate sulfotransferase 11 [Limosa lapponica baueri]